MPNPGNIFSSKGLTVSIVTSEGLMPVPPQKMAVFISFSEITLFSSILIMAELYGIIALWITLWSPISKMLVISSPEGSSTFPLALISSYRFESQTKTAKLSLSDVVSALFIPAVLFSTCFLI